MTISCDGNNIYLNAVFTHPGASFVGSPGSPSVGAQPVNAEYNVTKTIPIIDKASDYFVSVIRFDIPLNSVPLFIMPIIPNQSDSDMTPLIIGINYDGVDYSINLEYIPDNILNAPIQNIPNVQVITPYYYTYSFATLIYMMNLALTQVYINSGLQTAMPNFLPPYFIFDPVTQLISLVTPSFFSTLISPLVDVPSIYINEPLTNFIDSFQYSLQGYNQPDGKDNVFILTGRIANLTGSGAGVPYVPFGVLPPTAIAPSSGLPANPDYYIYTEEYSTMQYWTSLRKIIVSSSTLPIISEFVPVPNNTSSGVSATFPIITDFVPQIELAGQSRSIAYYIPTSQYRLVDLNSDIPIQKIDLRLYWQDYSGNIYPIQLSVFQQASIKLAFIKKDLYKSNLLKYK